MGAAQARQSGLRALLTLTLALALGTTRLAGCVALIYTLAPALDRALGRLPSLLLSRASPALLTVLRRAPGLGGLLGLALTLGLAALRLLALLPIRLGHPLLPLLGLALGDRRGPSASLTELLGVLRLWSEPPGHLLLSVLPGEQLLYLPHPLLIYLASRISARI